jgi:hypothetical protein
MTYPIQNLQATEGTHSHAVIRQAVIWQLADWTSVFHTNIKITDRQKPSGQLSFLGTVCVYCARARVCVCVRARALLPADARQPTEGNL